MLTWKNIRQDVMLSSSIKQKSKVTLQQLSFIFHATIAQNIQQLSSNYISWQKWIGLTVNFLFKGKTSSVILIALYSLYMYLQVFPYCHELAPSPQTPQHDIYHFLQPSPSLPNKSNIIIIFYLTNTEA